MVLLPNEACVDVSAVSYKDRDVGDTRLESHTSVRSRLMVVEVSEEFFFHLLLQFLYSLC